MPTIQELSDADPNFYEKLSRAVTDPRFMFYMTPSMTAPIQIDSFDAPNQRALFENYRWIDIPTDAVVFTGSGDIIYSDYSFLPAVKSIPELQLTKPLLGNSPVTSIFSDKKLLLGIGLIALTMVIK